MSLWRRNQRFQVELVSPSCWHQVAASNARMTDHSRLVFVYHSRWRPQLWLSNRLQVSCILAFFLLIRIADAARATRIAATPTDQNVSVHIHDCHRVIIAP